MSEEDAVQTLTSRMGTGGGNVPMMLCIGADLFNSRLTGDVAATVTTATGQSACNSGPSVLCITDQQDPVLAFTQNQRNEVRDLEGVAGCLSSQPGMKQQTYVLCMATQQGGAEIMENASPTLTAAAGMSGNNQPVICVRERCGCEGGGKGILIQDNVSGTIATQNDQFILCVVNDQGGV